MIYDIPPVAKPIVSNEILINTYLKTKNVWKVAQTVGLCGQSVHERLKRLGIQMDGSGKKITKDDIDAIKTLYEEGFERGDGKLDYLCNKLNRTKPFISRFARKLGYSNQKRQLNQNIKNNISDNMRNAWKIKEHPRGFLGHKHTEESKDIISSCSKKYFKNVSKEDERKRIEKALKTREKNNTMYQPRLKASWKCGWRNIGGIDKYYRSRWEANYARYLQFLKENGKITDWKHEPKTFWFDGVKRGTLSYLPDFVTYELDGSEIYHEVKGWMDKRSKTKINRMKKYHKDVKLLVIDSKAYKELNKSFSGVINGWE